MEPVMTLDDFKALIADGRIFTVTFIKRTTGEERVMNCRTGVILDTDPDRLGYDPENHHLLSVFDMKANGFRMVNLDSLVSLKVNGRVYQWEDDQFMEQVS